MPGAVAPAVSCAANAQKRTRVIDRYNRTHAGIPCAMVYGLYVISSVRRALWPPSPASSSLADLTPASGGQDHTISPSASATIVSQHPRPSHPRPTFVTIGRNVPLHQGGMREKVLVICPTLQAQTLRQIGTTGNLRKGCGGCPSCKMSEGLADSIESSAVTAIS